MQPPPVELIQRIDEALAIARAMSSGPQASEVDQLLVALLAVRQQALSGTLEASRGGSSLGLTRGGWRIGSIPEMPPSSRRWLKWSGSTGGRRVPEPAAAGIPSCHQHLVAAFRPNRCHLHGSWLPQP